MNGSSYEDYDKHGPDDLDDPYRGPATSRSAPPRESPSGWSGPDFRPDPRPRLDRGFDRDLDRVLDPDFERDFERDFDREPGRGSRRDRAGDFGRERGYGIGAPASRRSLVNDRTLVVAISVVIGVIIGFLVVAFVVKPLFDSGKKASGRGSPNATTSALDNTPVDRIPVGFKGTWRGTAVNQDGRSFRVTAVFKEGQTTASVLYTPMNCVGVLTLVRGTRSRLEMNLTDARPCTDGTVIVTRQVDGTVIYGWHHPGSRHHYRATLEAAG